MPEAPGSKARLGEHLRNMLGQRATAEMITELFPKIRDELKNGMPVPTLAELLAQKVLMLSIDPKKANQWAVELVFDRVEGKAAAGVPMRADARSIEGRLDDLTKAALNGLTKQFIRDAPAEAVEEEEDGPLDIDRQQPPASEPEYIPESESEDQDRLSSVPVGRMA